jgi:type IV secretory pathway TrbL component
MHNVNPVHSILQTDLSAAKQEAEALRATCNSLKEQLQKRVAIGRTVVGDYGGAIAASSNSNANTAQQQQSQQQQQQASSAHRYSNGLYAMSSGSPSNHQQQQHHNGGNTNANNATATWDNVHMSVEIERLRSIAQERGSQVCM